MEFSNLCHIRPASQGDDATVEISNPFSKSKSRIKWTKRSHLYQPTLGEELEVVKQDHLVKTHPANNHNRRTLVLKQDTPSWGFTIQSYGIHHKTEMSIEHLTYVDYVEIGGTADLAGMRKGDIILSINGHGMENTDHNEMVNFIQTCGSTLRMVVLFEDCSRKVEMHLRYMKLKKLLAAKEFELQSINNKLSRMHQRQMHSATSVGNMNRKYDYDSCRDAWEPSQEVCAVATLPRRPKLIGIRAKSDIPDSNTLESSFLDENDSASSSYYGNSLPRNKSPQKCRDHDNMLPVYLSSSSSSFPRCYVDKTGNLPQTVICTSIRNANSELCINKVDRSYDARSLDARSHGGWSIDDKSHDSRSHDARLPNGWSLDDNFPVQEKLSRPTSLLIPQITISPPSLTWGSSNQDYSSPSASLCSCDSVFSEYSTDISPGPDSLSVESAQCSTGKSENDNTDPTNETNDAAQLRQVVIRPYRAMSRVRSRSFRGSFQQSLSLSSGEYYEGSSNHVLTETNTRIQSDPELLRIKQGNLDLKSPNLTDGKLSITPNVTRQVRLFRSFSSPSIRMMSVLEQTKKRIMGNKHSMSVDLPKKLHLENDKDVNDSMHQSELHPEDAPGTNHPTGSQGPGFIDSTHITDSHKICNRSVSMSAVQSQDNCVYDHCNEPHSHKKQNINLSKYSYNHGNRNGYHNNIVSSNCQHCDHGNCHSCDIKKIPGVCFVHSSNNQSALVGSNCHPRIQPTNQRHHTGSCDSNGNFDQSAQMLTNQLNQSCINRNTPSPDNSGLPIRRKERLRPCSTGSDITNGSRSLSRSSSVASDVSSRSSGSFEYYYDPSTPSPDTLSPKDQKMELTPSPAENTIISILTSLKRPTRRILTYSRHKDLISQELRLMNINEEDEITKL